MKAFLFVGTLVLLAVIPSGDAGSGLAPTASYCKFDKQHTACLYGSSAQGGKNCGGIKKRGLTQNEIKKILDAHNNRRRTVAKGQQPGQPGAADMIKMTWDDEAAAIAQVWADQCIFQHDKSRNTVKGSKPIYNGQNLYMMGGGKAVNFDDAVGAWFNEVKLFSSAKINPFKFDYGAGHYTQVVWASSARVGCGYVNYGTNKHILACNYAPGGNLIGGSMYKIGKACSACPAGYKKCDNGLCSA